MDEFFKYARSINKKNKHNHGLLLMEFINKSKLTTKGIPLDTKLTNLESSVHFELYRKLRQNGIETYAEYYLGLNRCDLVVVKDGYIKCAIEVKKSKRRDLYKGSRQFLNYLNLKIPIIYCLGKENIDKTIEIVKEKFLKDEVIVEIIINN